MGRHSEYTPELAAEFCRNIANAMTCLEAAKAIGYSWEGVRKWLTIHKDFAAQYTHAREIAADHFEAEIIDAARKVTPESSPAARVHIDTLKWIAARRNAKKYGDKLALDHDGKIEVAVRRFTAPKRPAGSAD